MASKMELSAWTSAMLCVLDDRQWGKCSMSGNCSEQTVDFKNNQQCTQNVFFGRIQQACAQQRHVQATGSHGGSLLIRSYSREIIIGSPAECLRLLT